jgi:hypothetical protein
MIVQASFYTGTPLLHVLPHPLREAMNDPPLTLDDQEPPHARDVSSEPEEPEEQEIVSPQRTSNQHANLSPVESHDGHRKDDSATSSGAAGLMATNKPSDDTTFPTENLAAHV